MLQYVGIGHLGSTISRSVSEIERNEPQLTLFISEIQPRRLFDNGGVLSCGRREPKYVRGAYCLFCVRRRKRKTVTMAIATMRTGMRVETRPDAELDVVLAEPTFESVCQGFLLVVFSRKVWSMEWCFTYT